MSCAVHPRESDQNGHEMGIIAHKARAIIPRARENKLSFAEEEIVSTRDKARLRTLVGLLRDA